MSAEIQEFVSCLRLGRIARARKRKWSRVARDRHDEPAANVNGHRDLRRLRADIRLDERPAACAQRDAPRHADARERERERAATGAAADEEFDLGSWLADPPVRPRRAFDLSLIHI